MASKIQADAYASAYSITTWQTGWTSAFQTSVSAGTCLHRRNLLLNIQQVISQVSAWLLSRLVWIGSMSCQSMGANLLQSTHAMLWLLSAAHHRSAEAINTPWGRLYRSHATCSSAHIVTSVVLLKIIQDALAWQYTFWEFCVAQSVHSHVKLRSQIQEPDMLLKLSLLRLPTLA